MKTSRISLFIGLVVCVFVLSACTNSTQTAVPEQDQTQEMLADSKTDEVINDVSMEQPSEGGMVYSDSVSYTNPGGSDEVGFSLTTDDSGIVTNVEVEVKATNSTSVNRQMSFKSALSGEVVGKPLEGLRVDRVGGSSLTTRAFNEWVGSLN
jgi:hypothetical protein